MSRRGDGAMEDRELRPFEFREGLQLCPNLPAISYVGVTVKGKTHEAYGPMRGNRPQVRLDLGDSAVIEAFRRNWAGKNRRAGYQEGEETDGSHVRL